MSHTDLQFSAPQHFKQLVVHSSHESATQPRHQADRPKALLLGYLAASPPGGVSCQTFGNMKKSDRTIVMTSDGFHFDGFESTQIRWPAIRRITTHKLDRFTTDEIRLVFEHDESELVFEVSEEQPGFEEFKRYVEHRFRFPVAWWEAVMKPAFAANSAVLFVGAE